MLLLQDTIKETRGLRAQVAERAAIEVNNRLEQFVNKVDELCEKVNNADASRKRKRKTSHSAKVPSKRKVRSCFICIRLSTYGNQDRSKKDFTTYYKLKRANMFSPIIKLVVVCAIAIYSIKTSTEAKSKLIF